MYEVGPAIKILIYHTMNIGIIFKMIGIMVEPVSRTSFLKSRKFKNVLIRYSRIGINFVISCKNNKYLHYIQELHNTNCRTPYKLIFRDLNFPFFNFILIG